MQCTLAANMPLGPRGGCQLPMWLEDEKIALRFLIHDSDTKYTAHFVEFFECIIKQNHIEGRSEGKVIKTAIRCPPQNDRLMCEMHAIGHHKHKPVALPIPLPAVQS